MQESVLTGHGVVGFMYPGRDPARGHTVAQGGGDMGRGAGGGEWYLRQC